jgi:hypothetical protein
MKMHALFFVAAALFLVAGLLPVLRDGGSPNVVFLSSAVLWLVLGLAARKHARRNKGEPGV